MVYVFDRGVKELVEETKEWSKIHIQSLWFQDKKTKKLWKEYEIPILKRRIVL